MSAPASGLDALQGMDPALVSILRDSVLEHAARARHDIAEFCNFVMRDFSTKRSITLAPHQRVGLAFIMEHDRCVNMWPVGSSKTWVMTALTLFKLGQNPELRGAVVSASQGQAEKIVQLVRDYIETSAELRLVFPHLAPSRRDGDPWTQTAITVDRPPGIKDASLSAYGQDSKTIIGSRLNWIIVDDILNAENTATQEQRLKVIHWLDTSVFSRLDPVGAHVVLTNTPWHPADALHEAERRGWATMRMDVYGDIIVQDDVDDERAGKSWDSPLLRPADNNPANPACRLVAHDERGHDRNGEVPLWPEKFLDPALGVSTWEGAVEACRAWIERKRTGMLPQHFNQLYRSLCRDDASSMCKVEYLDRCLAVGRKNGIFSFVSEYRGPNLTFTGVDLAVSPGEENDDTCFFTFEARPSGLNVILDIDAGKWDGPTILEKLFDKQRRYNSVVRVENNACFPPGSRVLTRERGYVPIEEVVVGEHVWTHRARWRRVSETLSGVAALVTETLLADGRCVTSTPNHWFWLREQAPADAEPDWVSIGFAQRPALAAVASEDGVEWVPVISGPGTWRKHDGPVHNLVVEEDESFTVEDVVVHNAQDYIRQFALARDLSIPIKPHTTGRAKAHPEHGVPAIFVELMNGAWAIPNTARGEKLPVVRRLVDACIYYSPSKHTDDVLMAMYFAREQKKEWLGVGASEQQGGQGGSVGMSIMSR